MVPGWRTADGALRRPNTLVDLAMPALFMSGVMLAERVQLQKGPGGTTATYGLVPPAAWSQLPIPEDARASRVGSA